MISIQTSSKMLFLSKIGISLKLKMSKIKELIKDRSFLYTLNVYFVYVKVGENGSCHCKLKVFEYISLFLCHLTKKVTVLQIRRGNRDNLGLISNISP